MNHFACNVLKMSDFHDGKRKTKDAYPFLPAINVTPTIGCNIIQNLNQVAIASQLSRMRQVI